jgi:threonine/homoserine/homoserine lactone efflux protein
VLRNALRGGFGVGLRASADILTGLCLWTAASALGIAAVLAASATAFTVLELVGAARLVTIGITTLPRSRRPPAICANFGTAMVLT